MPNVERTHPRHAIDHDGMSLGAGATIPSIRTIRRDMQHVPFVEYRG